MEPLALEQRVAVATGVQQRTQLGLRQPFPVNAIVFRQHLLPRQQDVRITKPVGPDHARFDGIAVDRVATYPVADQLDGIERAAIKRPGAGWPELAQQRILAARKAAEDEPTVATRRAVTHPTGFEQDHVTHATLAQANGGIETGQAAADHAHPGLLPALQDRTGWPVGQAGPVPRHRVGAAHKGLLQFGDAHFPERVLH